MGSNLARNFASRGFKVSVYNRTHDKTTAFVNEFAGEVHKKGGDLIGTADLKQFVASLERPRKIIVMVKAGAPVDEVTAELVQLLQPGDMIIDAGNSFYKDTQRRVTELVQQIMSIS
jgi:6-phosphogluconate dehydrogenase